MTPNRFRQMVRSSPHRLALPIAAYPGLHLTGATAKEVVTNAQAQFEAQAALHERYRTRFVLSAMDLSVEAQAFGCEVRMSESEVPTVIGRLVTSVQEAEALSVPEAGDGRTGVYLEVVRRLRGLPGDLFVFGGCIGPFSLAARLVGVSEAMELTVTEPDLMRALVEKSAEFLTRYLSAFRLAGADGVIMAEPAAGLLSPRALGRFSSAYIRQIAGAVNQDGFNILLHNCAAKLVHLAAIQETGLEAFHFGAPMDILGALSRVGPDVVLCGNLDPAGVFVQLPCAEVATRTAQLLAATAAYRNFVISSGCDVPPNAPLGSLDAFYQAVGHFESEGLKNVQGSK